MGILKPVGTVVAVVGFVVLLFWGSAINSREREAKRNTWRTIRSGEFGRAEFGVRHVEKLQDEYGLGRSRHGLGCWASDPTSTSLKINVDYLC